MTVRTLLILVAAAVVGGCVSVRNENGLVTPSAFCCHVRGTVGTPRLPADVATLKSHRIDGSFQVNEWVFSGLSLSVSDVALHKAAVEAGIKQVDRVDYELTSYLAFFNRLDLVIYGR